MSRTAETMAPSAYGISWHQPCEECGGSCVITASGARRCGDGCRIKYPYAPGFKERGGTSQEAAIAIAPAAERLRDQVLAELRQRPGTADEVAARLGASKLGIRPRLSELREQGMIEKTGERRRNDSGASAAVWRAIA